MPGNAEMAQRAVRHALEKHASPPWPGQTRARVARDFARALDDLEAKGLGLGPDLGMVRAHAASQAFLDICRARGVDPESIRGAENNQVLPCILYAMGPDTFLRDGTERLGPDEGPDLPVVSVADEPGLDKFQRLEKVLEEGGLWQNLEAVCKRLEKKPSELKVLIKPNIAMCVRREDDGTFSDPELALYLVSLLWVKGFENITLAEAQNLYGNWFQNREVLRIAAYAGYLPDKGDKPDIGEIPETGPAHGRVPVADGEREAEFRLVDLTQDRVRENLGDLGHWELSREWVEADFRINLAKAKTHFFSYLTICVKNLYGALPAQNKMVVYHGKLVTGSLTAEMLRRYPAHFHIADLNTVSDGIMGAKMSAVSKKPKILVGGSNLLCVEAAASQILGVAPRASFYFREAHRRMGGLRPARVTGHAKKVKDFRQMPGFVVRLCVYMEKLVKFATIIGYVFNGQVDRAFPSRRPFLQPLAKLAFIFPYPMLFLTNWDMLKVYKARFFHWLFCLKHYDTLGLSYSNKKVRQNIRHLGAAHLNALLELLEKGNGQAVRLGHWVTRGKVKKEIRATTPSASRAVVRLLYFVESGRVDAKALAREIRARLILHQESTFPEKADFFARQNQ